jgi:hypothetical protein
MAIAVSGRSLAERAGHFAGSLAVCAAFFGGIVAVLLGLPG